MANTEKLREAIGKFREGQGVMREFAAGDGIHREEDSRLVMSAFGGIEDAIVTLDYVVNRIKGDGVDAGLRGNR